MRPDLRPKLCLIALPLLLAACSTTPTALAPSAAAPVLSTLSVGSGTYSMAEASGKIGAWASGRIGAWASGRIGAWASASTLANGLDNTFQANLPMWSQIHLTEAQSTAPALGAGVTVAVIDTGIDLSHPAFQGHLALATDMYDFVSNDAIPQEGGSSLDKAYGHGTAVASLILQVAPNTTILPIRVLSADGSGQTSAVASGIDWAVAHGAQIINLSMVSSVDNSLSTSIQNATSKGIYVTMAVGNDGTNPVLYPAKSIQATGVMGTYGMAVGSIDTSNKVSDFSNYGNQMNVLAPGRQLMVAYPGSNVTEATGTSFSTPVVSGVLALGVSKGAMSGTPLTKTLVAAETDVSAYNPSYTTGQGMQYNLLNAQAFITNIQ